MRMGMLPQCPKRPYAGCDKIDNSHLNSQPGKGRSPCATCEGGAESTEYLIDFIGTSLRYVTYLHYP
jgi:hypothetical protein